MRRFPQRVAFATLVLIVSIAGAALAAGTITGAAIRDNSITGIDIKDHSLTKKDFKGSIGDLAGRLKLVSGTLTVAAGQPDGGTLPCPSGSRVVSGGFGFDGPDATVFVNGPSGDQTGWLVALDNRKGAAEAHVTAVALCATAGQALVSRGLSRMARPTGRLARLIASRRR